MTWRDWVDVVMNVGGVFVGSMIVPYWLGYWWRGGTNERDRVDARRKA